MGPTLLAHDAAGFGQRLRRARALAHLLGRDCWPSRSRAAAADLNGGLHHRAKVKRVIQLFMNGGASQMDTFDYKPRLAELHGQKFDPGGGAKVESVTGSPGFKVLKSPFEFKQHGQCGRWVSSVFPHMATCVDDLAFLMSMASKTNVHGPASYMQNTGFVAARLSVHGRLDLLRPGQPDRQPADVRRAARPKRPALQQPGQFLRRLSAGEAPGHDHSPAPAEPDRRSVPARRPPSSSRPKASATGWRCWPQLNREHLEPVAGRFAARSPHRLLRAGRRRCSSAPPRCSTFRARPRRRASSTAWTRSRPRPSAATA